MFCAGRCTYGQKAWGNKLSLPAPSHNNHTLKEPTPSAMERAMGHPPSAQSLLLTSRRAVCKPLGPGLFGSLGDATSPFSLSLVMLFISHCTDCSVHSPPKYKTHFLVLSSVTMTPKVVIETTCLPVPMH